MEAINFNGKVFPVIYVKFPFGERKVSNHKLNYALMNFEGSYVSEEARLIDEKIYYFVEDEVLHFSNDKIVKLISSEI